MTETTDGPVFAAAPPERIELPGGVALRRPDRSLVPSGVAAVNASLDHLRPWMPWAAEAATLESLGAVYAQGEVGWAERRDFLYVLVEPDADGRDVVIGGSGLHGRLGPGGLEIGYWVHVDRAGRGIATEVSRALTSAALAVAGIERVRIRCEVTNVRSARIPQKLGFTLVQTALEEDGPCPGRVMQRWEVERGDWSD